MEFFRAKASALLMLSSTHKPPSLLFGVHFYASSGAVSHITRKQTNSTNPTCLSPPCRWPSKSWNTSSDIGIWSFLFWLRFFVSSFFGCFFFLLCVSFFNLFKLFLFVTCGYRVRHREQCTLWPHFLFLLFSSSADPSSRQHWSVPYFHAARFARPSPQQPVRAAITSQRASYPAVPAAAPGRF